MDSQQASRVEFDSREVHTHAPGRPLVWYCPSRWLLAHSDLGANICTLSSHMCLGDLNNDGEHLLALIDFKDNPGAATATAAAAAAAQVDAGGKPPYACRMRVYRGQQLIYNHFLDDVPSSLIASPVSVFTWTAKQRRGRLGVGLGTTADKQGPSLEELASGDKLSQTILTLTINEDAYLYHNLKPWFRFSLTDREDIMESLNKSESDAWAMARKNELDDGTMRELLVALGQELGSQGLSSHSNNFISLASSDERRRYLAAWRARGEQIMSMDTICCAAPGPNSPSGAQEPQPGVSFASSSRAGRSIGTGGSGGGGGPRQARATLERASFVLGTEDRHLLIGDLGHAHAPTQTWLHQRLPAAPDHILVEDARPLLQQQQQQQQQPKPPPPLSLKTSGQAHADRLAQSVAKILVSCRDRRIYSLDVPAGGSSWPADERASGQLRDSFVELVALKSNVLEMCWARAGDDSLAQQQAARNRSTFIVACLDRRFYCFCSHTGACKWVMECELPITCLVSLPALAAPMAGGGGVGVGRAVPEKLSLVGVASQANRFDFYVASTGRIVDSIYFQDDYPAAAKFGRFGREDNCLCLVTHRGHLLVFILKRTAKFAHGQCLSSAASYASDTLASCGQIFKQTLDTTYFDAGAGNGTTAVVTANQHQQQQQLLQADRRKLNLSEAAANQPSAFELTRSNTTSVANKILNSLMQSHDCDQVTAKHTLDAHAARPQLQIPIKGRDFVTQIVEQARRSRQSGRLFGKQMLDLRDKAALALGTHMAANTNADGGNRVTVTQVTGLGHIYRVQLALRLNVATFVNRYQDSLAVAAPQMSSWYLSFYLVPKNGVQGVPCHVRPYKFELPIERDSKSALGIKAVFEAVLAFKLAVLGSNFEPVDGDHIMVETTVIACFRNQLEELTIKEPLYSASVSISLTC